MEYKIVSLEMKEVADTIRWGNITLNVEPLEDCPEPESNDNIVQVKYTKTEQKVDKSIPKCPASECDDVDTLEHPFVCCSNCGNIYNKKEICGCDVPTIYWSDEDNGYVARWHSLSAIEDTKEKAWQELCTVLSMAMEVIDEDCKAGECDGEECSCQADGGTPALVQVKGYKPKTYEECIQDAKNKAMAGLANVYVEPKEPNESLEGKISVFCQNHRVRSCIPELAQIARSHFKEHPEELEVDIFERMGYVSIEKVICEIKKCFVAFCTKEQIIRAIKKLGDNTMPLDSEHNCGTTILKEKYEKLNAVCDTALGSLKVMEEQLKGMVSIDEVLRVFDEAEDGWNNRDVETGESDYIRKAISNMGEKK